MCKQDRLSPLQVGIPRHHGRPVCAGLCHQHIGGYYGMVKRLDEALGRLLDALKSLGVPVYHVPGNHDLWDAASASLYREIYGTTYWTFGYGSAQVIGLDTESNGSRLGPEHFEWLKQQLGRVPAPVRFTCTSFGSPVDAMLHFIQAASAPILAKSDNDAMLPPGWLRQSLEVLDRHPELTLLGIEAMNPLVDADTRNIQVQATLANKGERLRPGMFVNTAVGLPISKTVMTIPATAVLYNPYGDSVYIVEDDKDHKGGKVLRQQFVRLGEKRGDFVAVTSGLKGGEAIVSTGVFKLRNGQAVVVDNKLAPEFKAAPTPENN